MDPLVADGRLYTVIHMGDSQRFARVSVMSYVGEEDDLIVFNARPIAGTQAMPRSWIISVTEAKPGTERCLNKRAFGVLTLRDGRRGWIVPTVQAKQNVPRDHFAVRTEDGKEIHLKREEFTLDEHWHR